MSFTPTIALRLKRPKTEDGHYYLIFDECTALGTSMNRENILCQLMLSMKTKAGRFQIVHSPPVMCSDTNEVLLEIDVNQPWQNLNLTDELLGDQGKYALKCDVRFNGCVFKGETCIYCSRPHGDNELDYGWKSAVIAMGVYTDGDWFNGFRRGKLSEKCKMPAFSRYEIDHIIGCMKRLDKSKSYEMWWTNDILNVISNTGIVYSVQPDVAIDNNGMSTLIWIPFANGVVDWEIVQGWNSDDLEEARMNDVPHRER